jgi:short-subunit dehydrogenase
MNPLNTKKPQPSSNFFKRNHSRIILISRSEDKLAEVARRLQSINSECKAIYRAVDVADCQAVTKAVKSSAKELGEIDILINNVCFISSAALHVGCQQSLRLTWRWALRPHSQSSRSPTCRP